ncbi:hypothetical protein ANN_19286 [Periplaneta americana]|uniref:Mos1 transposase HTH domain-containing protein n=1 Tax=Periplaneta americana TaxID=6978 RepID=A0ABQ8SAE0_PERAM|nr:hypothetical protein ANN_19286 [Periplaneta americana]
MERVAVGLVGSEQDDNVEKREKTGVLGGWGNGSGLKFHDVGGGEESERDGTRFEVCSHFDADHYSKVQAAYRLLGKTQMAMDQLHMHFSSAIHNTAFNVVHGYVELCSGAAQDGQAGGNTFHKKQYKHLCTCVTAESFIPCLIDLCKALWGIMHSYHQVISWHQRNDSEKLSTDGVSEPVDFEASFNKQYVRQKLGNGLSRIWHDVQARISTFLLGSDLAWYKFDEFLQVLSVVHSSYCTALEQNGCTDIFSANCEIRAVIRFLHAQKQSPAEIHRQLCNVYGPDIMSNSMVRRWCRQFTEGQTNVHDEDRSGRLSLVTSELESVRQVVLQKQHFTFSEFCGEFLQMTCSLLHEIVSWWLGFWKVCARWVPNQLKGDEFLDNVVTRDETWASHTTP